VPLRSCRAHRRIRSAIVSNSGKLVIIGLVAIGLAASLAALWYHRQSGRRALDFWGTQTAVLIARAPEVEALELRPADEQAADQDNAPTPDARPDDRPIQRLGIGGRFYLVARAADASQARGAGNIRRAMVLDATYQWDSEPAVKRPRWRYALEFRDGPQAAIVLFDFDSGQLGSTTGTKTVAIDPAAVDDWRSFFEEQFEKPR
jgi:hypothetical protein